jgi:Na+-driven multidrug efflux pump
MGSYICSSFEHYVSEAFQLSSVAVPSVVINSLEMLMVVVDTIMLGRLGKGHLAAATIGWSYINRIWMFIEGVLTAQDTLTARSVGTCDYKLIRYWLIVSALVACILTTLGSVLLIISYAIIGYMFQIKAHIAIKASIHICLMIPGFWALAAYRVVQKYFQSQGIMPPIIQSMIAGNIINFLGK